MHFLLSFMALVVALSPPFDKCSTPTLPPSFHLFRCLRPVGGSDNLLNLLPFTLRTWIKELLNCTDVAASWSD